MTGFDSKRDMAAEKQLRYEDEWRRINWRCSHGWLRGEQCEICIAWNAAPESAKYLRSALDAFGPDAGISLDQKVWSKLHAAIKAVITPSAQEPPSEWAGIKAILDEYGLQAIDFVADFKAALAQPAQEPVALNRTGIQKLLKQSGYDNASPLEMDAFISGIRHREAETLETTPPQRTWVGLTDAQAERLYRNISPTQQQDVKSLAAFKRLLRVIEAAHGIKEKNT